MNVALCDIDSHNFPNLVLMKLSAWYKSQGHNVELIKPSDVMSGNNLFTPWDKIIGSCVFDWNKELAYRLESMGVEIGGTGTNKTIVLPEDIEHIYPDYFLYGIHDTAYGFLTRGCPRQCSFCIVSKKEGAKSKKVADVDEFWKGEKNIELLDPNTLACEDSEDLLQQLIETKALVNFNQGLDVRMLTDNHIGFLEKIRVKMIHFAWDNPKDEKCRKALESFSKTFNHGDFRKYRVYVLTNYWSTHEEDLMRVYWLRDHGYDQYITIYERATAPSITKRMQRWVNNKFVFRVCKTFDDYK